MFRRRLSRLSRMALHVAFDCAPPDQSFSTVFCSQHGELTRTLGLLNSIVQREALSPTSFGLSVHNAASGLFAIARADPSPTTSIASGVDTLESGFIHAACALNSGYDSQVLLVVADEPVPPPLEQYGDPSLLPHAAAFLLTGSKSESRLSLSSRGELATPHHEPHGLALVRFLIRGGTHLEIPTERLTWIWDYHAN